MTQPYLSSRETIPLLLLGGCGPDRRPGDLAGRQVLRHEHGHQAQEVLGPSQAGRLNTSTTFNRCSPFIILCRAL